MLQRVFHVPGASHAPISLPPMKSVTNSNPVPFQVNRYGHEDGLRSSSVIVVTPAFSGAASGPVSA